MARIGTAGRRRRHSWNLWLPITVSAALAAAATVATQTPRVALDNPDQLAVRPSVAAPPLPLPRVTYEVDGRGEARVSYLTGDGELAAATVPLPWTLDVAMSKPMRPASVTATTVDGATLTCRLAVDGIEQDARAAEPGAGVVLCGVAAA